MTNETDPAPELEKKTEPLEVMLIKQPFPLNRRNLVALG